MSIISRNRFVNGELIVMTGLIDKRKVLCATVHRLMIMRTVCVWCVRVCLCVCVVEVCVCVLNKSSTMFLQMFDDVLYTAPYGVVFLLMVCVCVCVCSKAVQRANRLCDAH